MGFRIMTREVVGLREFGLRWGARTRSNGVTAARASMRRGRWRQGVSLTRVSGTASYDSSQCTRSEVAG